MTDKSIAIIPARGGSKRIPNKNIIQFNGKPMIAWTISAAIESMLFDRVLVSTDDKDIADIAKYFGADAPFLRDECNDDFTPISQATIHAVKQAENHWNEKYSLITQLMANCPLRTASDISLAQESFFDKKRTFQISCFKYGWMNPWWACEMDLDGRPTRVFSDALNKRSQDLPDLYCPTGAIWIAKRDALLEEGTFYGAGHCFEVMPTFRAVDIDDYDDLAFSKALLSL